MISDGDLFDGRLRAALQADGAAINPTTDLTSRVRARMASRPRHSVHSTLKWAAAVAAAAALTTSSAFAIGSATGLIRIHWDHARVSGSGKVLNVSVPASFETTVADAERRLGFHVQTLSSWRLRTAVFHPSITAINGKPIKHNAGAVALYYTVDSGEVEIVEQMDPNGPGPMDVMLKQFSGPLPAGPAPGMTHPSVETIEGGQYLVFRYASGTVATVQWKTTDGILININAHSRDGLPMTTILSLIRNLS